MRPVRKIIKMINVEKKDKSIMDKRSILGQIINLQCLCIVLVICGFILCNVAVLFAADVPLLWNAPTKNQDGTPLTDLAGYKVHYGGSSRNYSKVINAGNKLSHIVSGLNVGDTYYFAITAYDTSGNESGYSNEKKVVIPNSNNAPVAAPGGKYYVTEGLEVVLDGSASTDSDGSIVLYEWDINNDGIYDYISASPTQDHTYAQQIFNTVTLRVTQGISNTAATTVNVSDTSPTADFSASPTGGDAPLTVSFTNNSTGYDQPLSYEWDFDNNGSVDSTLINPSYDYPAGTYTAKLRVEDSDGSTNTLTKTNYIASCLPPIRVDGMNPPTLQEAFDAAVEGSIIQVQTGIFTENISMNNPVSRTLQGGFSCDYNNVNGTTVINGNLTINDGKLTIDYGTIELQQ